jgi:DNA-binding response OmpR family regulator
MLQPPQLKVALEAQRKTGNRLASECNLQGLVPEERLLSVLSAQVGVPGVPLNKLVLPLRFLEVVAEQTARKHSVLPIHVDSERVFLAMADPDAESLMAEIAFTSGRKVLPCVALHGLLRRAIEAAYPAKQKGELEYRGPHAEDQDPARDHTGLSLIFAEQLTQLPKDLVQSVDKPVHHGAEGAADVDEEEILIETDGSDEGEAIEVEVAADGPAVIVQRPPTATESPTAAPQQNLQGVRVLVVDDDPELLRLVSRMLRSRGMVVEEASRGLEALSQLKKTTPDLIVLDAMLPEIHGFDICKKIKSSDRYGNIPVIMISSVYRGWRFARDLKDTYGVSEFLEKPFEMQSLLNTVDRVLANAKRQGGDAPLPANTKKAIQEGVKRYKAGDVDGAIESYREGLRADPLSAKLHYQLGILYLKKKGMAYQAMQEFEEAVALEPEMFVALRNLAILYQSKGFKSKAIEMWERSLRCSPDEETRQHIKKHLVSLL